MSSTVPFCFQRIVLLLCLLLSCFACQESRDPQTPEGALRLFGVALEQGDQALIKASLSQKTDESLKNILSLVQKLEVEIQKFPNEQAQAWAQHEALGDRLSKVKKGSDTHSLWHILLGEHLEWAKKQAQGSVEQGVNLRRILSGTVEMGEIKVLTRSNNPISLRKEGVRWVITSFEEPLAVYISSLKRSLEQIEENRTEWERREKLNLDLPQITQAQ